MKAKNILMSILLVMGSIAAKAAGYPPELALVSQPVMVYNYNSVTIYYDVQNIGDYTYRGYINVFLDPDNGYCYGEKYVRVCPGRIKRVAIEIPAYRANPARLYMVMPYYTLGGELYSFTTFEYFEPLTYHWDGPRVGPYIVIHVGPRIRHYHRPASYRYYYDGFRPPMPPHGFGPGMPPPMNPMHHTYNYHHNNGGYPATNNWNNEPGASAGSATVRPNGGNDSGSMSSGNANSNNVAPGNNGSSSSIKPNTNNGGGSTGNSSGSNSSVSRPDSNSRPSGTSTGSASGHTGNSSNSRVNNNSNSSRPSGNSNSGNSNVSRSSNNSRPSGTSTGSSNGSSSRSGRSVSGSSNSNRSSGTSSSTSGRSSNSSNSSSGRSGSSGGRR